MDDVDTLHHKTEFCPVCKRVLHACSNDAAFTRRSLQVRPGSLIRHSDNSVTSLASSCCEVVSFLTFCRCGLFFSTSKSAGEYRFAFRCAACASWSPGVGATGQCLACILAVGCGIGRPYDLMDTLHDSRPFMTATKQDTIDAILAGLLKGEPSLMVKELDYVGV